MRAIQKEMGDRDDITTELKDLEDQIKKKKMSSEATDKVKKEFKKLKRFYDFFLSGISKHRQEILFNIVFRPFIYYIQKILQYF